MARHINAGRIIVYFKRGKIAGNKALKHRQQNAIITPAACV